MSTENRTENVNNAILDFIYTELRPNHNQFGWAVYDLPFGRPDQEIVLRGYHDEEADAIAAATRWIRYKRPDIVKMAIRQAIEGERYRATKK